MTNPYASSDSQQLQTPAQQPKKKKGGCLKWGVGIIAVLAIGGALTNGNDGSTRDTAATSAARPESSVPAAAGADAPEAGASDSGVSAESKNALRSAKNYIAFAGFSQARLYDQLTSDYADKYSAEAAQYAIDNIDADWNEEALQAAQNYVDTMPFSRAKLYQQLTSDSADKFTAEQAQYAVDNVHADWAAEAVQAAENYQRMAPMSGDQLLNQLTSEYGDHFEYNDAQAAVAAVGL